MPILGRSTPTPKETPKPSEPAPPLTGKPNPMAGGGSILPAFSVKNRLEALIVELSKRDANPTRSKALDTLKQLQTDLAQEG